MPIGVLVGLLLGLTAAWKTPHEVYADLVMGFTMGGCYDVIKRRGVLGFFSWLFLLFFGAVTLMVLGPAARELGYLPAFRVSQWALGGCLLGAAVWWGTHWARLRSGKPIGKWPGLLALACLLVTMEQQTVGIIGMFLVFVWWTLQALTGVLRANPERLAIEARQREAKRPF